MYSMATLLSPDKAKSGVSCFRTNLAHGKKLTSLPIIGATMDMVFHQQMSMCIIHALSHTMAVH